MSENNSEVNNNEVKEPNQEKVIDKKPKFFQKVWYSIIKFEKYPEMSAEGVPSALKYLCKIMAIFAIAITFQLGQIVNSVVRYITNELPDFYYKDEVLTVESDSVITIDNVKLVGKIIIDSSTEDEDTIQQYKNSITDEEEGIIFLKDKMIIKNVLSSGEITYNYKEILEQNNITEFTKQNIIDFAQGQEIASLYVSFAVVIFIMYLVSTARDSIVLAILGYITALIAKMKMKFVAIYNMAVYALTLSIILNLIYLIVNMFTGFRITYFQVMYTSVAYIYLVAAIFIIKSEFIKKQAELMKILEEEQKQKKDTLENENDDNSKEENKETKKEDKNDDVKKEDDKNNGEEPEGSNA